MSFLRFVSQKFSTIFLFLVPLIFFNILFGVLHVPYYPIVFVDFFFILFFIISIILEYFKKLQFFKEASNGIEHLEKKYLLAEVLERPDFIEGQLLHDYLRLSLKSMNDEIAKYNQTNNEYREYIEQWVHEIKTPIAGAKLLIENHPNEITADLTKELNKVEEYVQQALYYARSNSVEKDYYIKEFSLESLVKQIIKKNASIIIEKKITLKIENLDFTVYTDSKWFEFIFTQLLSNSVRYTPENGTFRFWAQKNNDNVVLYFEDSGIGIPQKDLSRVFEKSFTGENGRKFQKSTGMGLYLAKILSEKLGMKLSIRSEENKGTTAAIVFPKNRLILLES